MAGDLIINDNGDGTCTITNYLGPGGNVTISDILNGLTVTIIGAQAFDRNLTLTSVSIPGSVTTIGDYAFRSCSDLTSVTIGNSVTAIGEWAFYDCRSLSSVTIGNSVTSIEEWAFQNCRDLTNVTIGNGVVSIEASAFSSCRSLTSVTIPNSVTTIGDNAFSGCSSLTSVTIPDSVTIIGDRAFQYCDSLTSVTMIGFGAFGYCSGLTSLTIGNSVTTIEDWAFEYCVRLTCINFKGNPPVLGGEYVFYNINNATVYYLPGSTEWGADYGGLPTEVWPLSIADLDMDGDVMFDDFAVFAAAWQAVDGVDAEYNPLCDISDPVDGVINNADLEVFTNEWLIPLMPQCLLSMADMDKNGDVNFSDFAIFAAAWEAEEYELEYNLLCDIVDTADGEIDIADLQVFAAEWLITPSP